MKTVNKRQAAYDIHDIFLNRWSSRAMTGDPISRPELLTIFEAARWAPSSGNNQPWRFIYGIQGTEHFQKLYRLLDEGNQEWCIRAGALVVVIGKNTRDNGKPIRTRSLDVGAAWENLALQGVHMGLVIHGMAGFEYDRAATELNIPDDYTVEMMIAVGKPGKPELLSEKNQNRETPNTRRSVEDSISEGSFK